MEGRQSYFSRKHAFVLLGISLCIGGFFYFYQKGRAPVDPGYEISLPKGVEVVEDASGVRVVNRVDGYDVLANGHHIYYRDNLIIQDFIEPTESYGGSAGCKVTIKSTSGNLNNIQNEVKQICEADTECKSFTIGNVIENNIDWYKIEYNGDFVGSGWPEFKTAQNGKIINLYFTGCSEKEFIDSILLNFTLL